MSKLLCYIFCLLCFSSSIASARDFVAGFEDIPLMDGLEQIDSADISFGNEETRFIEAQLQAPDGCTFANVQKFYQETLPQLGWSGEEKNATLSKFRRENDILEIAKIGNSPLKISISLKNRN